MNGRVFKPVIAANTINGRGGEERLKGSGHGVGGRVLFSLNESFQFDAGAQRRAAEDAGEVYGEKRADVEVLPQDSLKIEIGRPGQHAELDHNFADQFSAAATLAFNFVQPFQAVGGVAQPPAA